MWISHQALDGEHIVLEPLTLAHIPDLQQALTDGRPDKLWFATVPSHEQMPDYVAQAIAAAQYGDIAFAVRCKKSQKIVGTTRYYQVDQKHRRALIGYTWYAQSARRSAINSECKYLLLKQLFEDCGAIAAEFRTHYFNQISRQAIERLGAKQDGILRQHQIMPDGSYRDTVVYSIINSEWPAVKANLLSRLSL